MIVGCYLEDTLCQTWNFLLLNDTFSIENDEFSYFRPMEKKKIKQKSRPKFWAFYGRSQRANKHFFSGLIVPEVKFNLGLLYTDACRAEVNYSRPRMNFTEGAILFYHSSNKRAVNICSIQPIHRFF